jgi:hypothetical protein
MVQVLLELVESLEATEVFTSWKTSECVLSHLFVPLSSTYETKSAWEVGYYLTNTQKVTTFMKNESWSIKEQDQPIAQTNTEEKITPLVISEVHVSFDDALVKIKELIAKEFPTSAGILGDGFCILQHFKKGIVWNVSFITKKLTMINIKISAVSAEYISKDEISFLG